MQIKKNKKHIQCNINVCYIVYACRLGNNVRQVSMTLTLECIVQPGYFADSPITNFKQQNINQSTCASIIIMMGTQWNAKNDVM